MFISNFEELIEKQNINIEDYCLCDQEQTMDLIKMGFIPVAGYKGKFIFLKDKIIDIIKGSEINVSEYEILS